MSKKSKDTKNVTTEEKLRALYHLQSIDTEIDKIRILRGELPLEIEDLEDEVTGLETRINKYKEETEELNNNITSKKNEIVEAQTAIKKYEEQQKNVRNNREFDSLSKEIEFQSLEIELCEKRVREFTAKEKDKSLQVEGANTIHEERSDELKHKKSELDTIISETQKEEDVLLEKSNKIKGEIEERLINAYTKLRENALNGLSVVSVERDACGGCFNRIPPQRKLDINSRKKIIVCEYCGRILVDTDLNVDLDVLAKRRAEEVPVKKKRTTRTTKKK